MKSKTHAEFWACYNALPEEIQRQAREKFLLWQTDPFNTAFHFKALFDTIWSVRINQNYRAVGRRNGNAIIWFWIGTHANYNELLKRLQ